MDSEQERVDRPGPRVALVDPGLYTFAYDDALATALSATGAHVTLVARAPRAGERVTVPVERAFGHHDERLLLLRPSTLARAARAVSHREAFARFAATASRFDIVHFQWLPAPALDASLVATIAETVPVIFTLHDTAPHDDGWISRVAARGLRHALRRAHHVIVHTEDARHRAAALGACASRISVIPHGVLPTTVGGPQRPREHLTVLAFGTIRPYKGLDVLIEALGRLPAGLRDRVRLRVVGRAAMPMEPLLAHARRFGVASQVDWDLRFVDTEEIGGIISDADIVAFPYRRIDASGVLASCLTHGKPILASDIGVFRELLGTAAAAALVPPEDSAALAATLESLIRSPGERERLGERARWLAQAIPSWSEIARRTLDIYSRACRDHEARRRGAAATL